MTRSILMKSALCALLVTLTACNLLKVTDTEDSNSGRGAKLHDPYQSVNSGAIRLSLQYFNGCAVLPNGQTVAKNSTPVPYPDVCPFVLGQDPTVMVPATGKIKLLVNTKYFLNQLTLTEMLTGQHPSAEAAVTWLKTQSMFSKLDMSGLGQGPEEWSFVGGAGIVEDSWIREVLFENAAWQRATDDTFTVEVLDSGGVARASQVYARDELLVSSPYTSRSRFSWRTENLQPPRFPGDTEPRGVVSKPGGFPQPLTYRTLARLDLVGSTNPFKTVLIPNIPGDGAIRLTWSQLPDHPFYFPVTFVQDDELPTTCTDDQGQATKCSFGLDPRLVLAPPQDGSFYKPGETVNTYIDLRDSLGHHLHSPDLLPSANEMATDQGNGLFTLVPNISLATVEHDSISNVQVGGPLQNMKMVGDPNLQPEFFAREFPFPVFNDEALAGLVPGEADLKWPTRQSFHLPADAKPGTYVAFVKFNRYFMGERITKMAPFFFQVGQDEPTTYPNEVGNCQICHKGVLSLDNLRHGLAVDHVEGCKTCHHYNSDSVGRMQERIHQIHMHSPKYTAAKNDCSICHLTRESALRPSLNVCGSCHPSVHDTQYFDIAFSQTGQPNRFGNCAQSCHAVTSPQQHIYPGN